MLKTGCESCGRSTPIKAHNSPNFWYCHYCRAPLELKNIEILPSSTLKRRARNEFPQATHYRAVEGDASMGVEVVINTPPVSSLVRQYPTRPKRKSLLLFSLTNLIGSQEKRWGEIFYDISEEK